MKVMTHAPPNSQDYHENNCLFQVSKCTKFPASVAAPETSAPFGLSIPSPFNCLGKDCVP